MGKMVRFRGFLLGVMILFIAGLVACSGGDTENSSGANDDGNTGGDNSDGKQEEKITLTFWNIWTEPSPQNEASLSQVEKFMEENPNIIIEQQNIPHDQYKVKLKTQAAGQQLPDLMQVWPGGELKPLVNGGLIEPLDDIIGNWDGLIDASQLKDYQVDGTQYAIPSNVNPTSLVYYDKDRLAAVGYDEFPETYEEFKNLITALRESGDIPIALGNKAQWLLQSSYISTIADRLTGSDFLQDVMNGDRKFTDPKFIEAVNIIKEMAELEAFNSDYNSLDNIQQRDLFVLGETAMMIDGAWSVGPVSENISEDRNIGIAPFPAVAGGDGTPGVVSSVTGTAIALNSELEGAKLEAAQKFMKGYFTEEYYESYLEAGVLVPANVETPEGVSPLLGEVSDIVSNGVAPVYDAVLPVDVIDIINSGLQEVTLGTMTPEELAERLQTAIEKQK